MWTQRIQILFFDLDNTLFDHTRSQHTTLKSMLQEFPDFTGVNQEEFIACYDRINSKLWQDMAANRITASELRELRFKLTCDELNIAGADAKALSRRYLELYSQQEFLFPGALQTLDYLKPKYRLGLLTNGFTKTQETKLDTTGLRDYFQFKIYSHDVGAMKPSPVIFQHAMELARSRPEETAFVGDSPEDDIAGAKAVGWRAILFDPDHTHEDGVADYKISSLAVLQELF